MSWTRRSPSVSGRTGRLISRYPFDEGRIADVNGEPAIATTVEGREWFAALDVRDGLSHGIYAVANPDKLTHLHTQQ